MLPRPPQGTLLGALSAPFPPWDARGTLKWRFLEGFRVEAIFLMKFRSKIETFGRLKTLIIRCRGCKNHVFGYIRFSIILGTILEVILEPKMHPKSHFDFLWTPSVAILTLLWSGGKNEQKACPRRGLKKRVGGMRGWSVARW